MKIEGIVINSNKYQDSSLVCNVLTSDGLMPLLAKGINKSFSKNRHLVFDLTIAIFDFVPSRKRNILTGGDIIKSSSYLFDSYDGLLLINFVKEFVLKVLTKNDFNLIFPFLKEMILNINENSSKNDLYHKMALLFDFGLKISGFDPLKYSENSEDNNNSRLILDLRNGEVLELKNSILLLKYFNYLLEYLTTEKINTISLI